MFSTLHNAPDPYFFSLSINSWVSVYWRIFRLVNLADFLEARTKRDIKVFAPCWVSINGRVAKGLIDHSVDLTQEQDSLFGDYSWVYCKAN